MGLRILTRRGRLRETADTTRPAFVGLVGLWPSDTPPPGWLICDGSSFSAVTYPHLAAVLGGTTLPDYRGRTCVGQGTHADVAAVGDDEGAAIASRTPNHGHAAGVTTHQHSLPHTHTAAAHVHPTADAHAHASQGHSHVAATHGHGTSGSTGPANQGVSADGVGAGSGTETRNTAHTHSAGTLVGDGNTPGPHTGYNNAAFGGVTSTVNPGNTGSAAPVTHAAVALNSSLDTTSNADVEPLAYNTFNWIVKAAA